MGGGGKVSVSWGMLLMTSLDDDELSVSLLLLDGLCNEAWCSSCCVLTDRRQIGRTCKILKGNLLEKVSASNVLLEFNYENC